MLTCGICSENFPDNDLLRLHLETHANTLFEDSDDSNESIEFVGEIKTEFYEVLEKSHEVNSELNVPDPELKEVPNDVQEILNDTAYEASKRTCETKASFTTENLSQEGKEPKPSTKLRKKPDKKLCKKCSICNSRFSTKAKLKSHLQTSHGQTFLLDYSKRPKETYYCIICNNLSHSKRERMTHLNRSHKSKNGFFVCPICRRQRVKRIVSLMAHLRKHEGVKICSLCSHLSRSPTEHSAHIDTFHSEPDYACNVCNMKFRYRASFENHYKCHLN